MRGPQEVGQEAGENAVGGSFGGSLADQRRQRQPSRGRAGQQPCRLHGSRPRLDGDAPVLAATMTAILGNRTLPCEVSSRQARTSRRRTRGPFRVRRIQTDCRRFHARSTRAWRARHISRISTAADRYGPGGARRACRYGRHARRFVLGSAVSSSRSRSRMCPFDRYGRTLLPSSLPCCAQCWHVQAIAASRSETTNSGTATPRMS